MSSERIAAAEKLAMDVWRLIANRTQSIDDVVLALSMLLVQAILNAPDPERAAEPLMGQVDQIVRDVLEETFGGANPS